MKKHLKLWLILIALVLCAAAVVSVVLVDRMSAKSAVKITEAEGEAIVTETIRSLPLKLSQASVAVADRVEFRVSSMEYGDEKNIILHGTYTTVDVLSEYRKEKDAIFSEVYEYYVTETAAGKKISATHILMKMGEKTLAMVENAASVSGETDLVLYDTGDGKLELWLNDETVNLLLGGFLTVKNDIAETDVIVYGGEEISIANNNSLRNGISSCFGLNNYSMEKPDTSTFLMKKWNAFASEFARNFIANNQWTYLAYGLLTTLAITGLALLLGVFIGFVTAIVRVTHDKTGKLSVLNGIGSLYVTVIRGTPVMVQLMIIYFVMLLPIGVDKFPAAVLCFGLNSGAYVSEIIRGGIMAVDGGQMEAGRSLGFGYVSTMIYVVIPQAFKAVLPALCNEFIALLKETSVAFYIGVADLTQGGLKIRSITYSNFMPLIAVALIYLTLVLILTKLVRILERRLRRSER